MSTMVERFWSKVNRTDLLGCWPWLAHTKTNRSGIRYGAFRLGTMRAAHRVAWEIANAQTIPAGMVIRHSCDNGVCCNPAHLIIGTQQENVADRYERGRDNNVRGSLHGNAKLIEAEISKIRELLRAGASQRAVAQQFGVSPHPINAIANGRAWRHV